MKTGKVIVKQLVLVDKITNNPILSNGLPVKKLNTATDPDYIAPYYDSSVCGDNIPLPTTTIGDPCDNLVTNIEVDCSGAASNVIHLTFSNTSLASTTLNIRKNGILVFTSESVQIIYGNAYVNTPKSITGSVTLEVTRNECTKQYAHTIDCVEVTTTLPPPTTTQPPLTTTQPPVTTTLPPVTTTVAPPYSAVLSVQETACNPPSTTMPIVTTTLSQCTATGFSLTVGFCDANAIYAVNVNVGGTAPNIQIGYSNVNNIDTVQNWIPGTTANLLANGVNYYVFVRYGAELVCNALVGQASRSCTAFTTTVPQTTTQAPTTTTACSKLNIPNITIMDRYNITSNPCQPTGLFISAEDIKLRLETTTCFAGTSGFGWEGFNVGNKVYQNQLPDSCQLASTMEEWVYMNTSNPTSFPTGKGFHALRILNGIIVDKVLIPN